MLIRPQKMALEFTLTRGQYSLTVQVDRNRVGFFIDPYSLRQTILTAGGFALTVDDARQLARFILDPGFDAVESVTGPRRDAVETFLGSYPSDLT